MNKVFIDSNIWLYAFIDSLEKTKIAKKIISKEPNIVLSVQVINEVSFNLIKKLHFDEGEIRNLIEDFYSKYEIVNFNEKNLRLASNIRTLRQISYWDSLIIASALENDCSILYSEDMQHNQIIENKLKIVNPFLYNTD